MNIYLIRHAQSQGNKERRFYGVSDTPLSDEGRASLSRLATFFKNKPMDKIYVSPLSRTTETAEIIFGDMEQTLVDGLKEINFGDWETMFVGDVMKNYPKQWDNYTNDWLNFSFPNGDTLDSFQARVTKAIKSIVAQTDEQDTIAIVVHNGVVKTALSYLLLGDNRLSENFSVQNATVNHIEIMEGFAKLRLLNYLQRI